MDKKTKTKFLAFTMAYLAMVGVGVAQIPRSEVSAASIAKMGRCENVTTDVLVRICDALDCTMDDILEIQRPQPVLRETRMDDP